MYESELRQTVYSGANWIDALISSEDRRTDLNPLTVSRSDNRVYFSFEIDSDAGRERGLTSGSTSAFNVYQQAAARELMAHAAAVTGIDFIETTAAQADIQFGYCDIIGPSTAGISSQADAWRYDGSGRVSDYQASRMVFLDSQEWGSENLNPVAGSQGYETLLHEIGHALGLEHPFEDPVRLPASVDTTDYTVMSYTAGTGHKSSFQAYDIAALAYLYGFDGLGGEFGLNAPARYYYGTAGNDSFSAGSQSAFWYGAGGQDSLRLNGDVDDFSWDHGGNQLVAERSGVRHSISDTIEVISFNGGSSYSFAQLVSLTGGGSSPTEPGQREVGLSGQNNVFVASAGDDTLVGAEGIDRVEFSGRREEFNLTRLADGLFRIEDKLSRFGTDRMESIERLYFADTRLALDLQPDQAAGQALLFIGALAPQLTGTSAVVGNILSFFDQGYSMLSLFQLAVNVGLVADLAGGSGDAAVARLAYLNLVGNEPDAPTLAALAGYMNGSVASWSQAEFMTAVAGLELNGLNIGLAGLQQSGVEYL